MAASLLENLAEYLGSPESAVRLILSILIGYPFALVYRQFLFHQSPSVIHLFHVFSGLSLAVFNFGKTKEKNEGVIRKWAGDLEWG
ncbi:lysophospholipid acyltransferase 5 isoform X1 [Tachysurus ichikawai]